MDIFEEFTSSTIPDNFYWLNEPDTYHFGNGLELLTEAETDFWQNTHYGFQRDNGHCLFTNCSGDFTALTHVVFEPKSQYDQCGIMVRFDQNNWIKVATEYENDEISRLGSVVTDLGFSDWATQDVPSDLTEMWYRVSRQGSDFLIEHADDGSAWQQMRLTHLHAGAELAGVGLFACSPIGSHLRCRFSQFRVTENQWRQHEN